MVNSIGIAFKKNLSYKKAILLFVLLCVCLFPFARPQVIIASAHGWRLSPFLFTFVANDGLANMLVLAGSLLLFAFSPSSLSSQFKSNDEQNTFGTIAYVLLASLLYVIVMIVICVVYTIPVISWSLEWNLGWKMIAYSTVNDFPQSIGISTLLIKNYSALNALLISSLLEWMFLVFIGLTSYLFSLGSNERSSAFLIVLLLVLDTSIYNMFPTSYCKFSPLSLSMLSTYTEEAARCGITPTYVAIFYGLSIPILMLLICVCSARRTPKEGRLV